MSEANENLIEKMLEADEKNKEDNVKNNTNDEWEYTSNEEFQSIQQNDLSV